MVLLNNHDRDVYNKTEASKVMWAEKASRAKSQGQWRKFRNCREMVRICDMIQDNMMAGA